MKVEIEGLHIANNGKVFTQNEIVVLVSGLSIEGSKLENFIDSMTSIGGYDQYDSVKVLVTFKDLTVLPEPQLTGDTTNIEMICSADKLEDLCKD